MKSKKEFERRVKAQGSDTEIGSNETEACLKLMSSSVINVAWHDWLCENPLFIIHYFSTLWLSSLSNCFHQAHDLLSRELWLTCS